MTIANSHTKISVYKIDFLPAIAAKEVTLLEAWSHEIQLLELGNGESTTSSSLYIPCFDYDFSPICRRAIRFDCIASRESKVKRGPNLHKNQSYLV